MAKHRLNLDLSTEEFHELAETVRLDGDSATQSSVTRRALQVFNRILKNKPKAVK